LTHGGSEASLSDLEAMRDRGWMGNTGWRRRHNPAMTVLR
jgi:hypothetical protein